jgi:uncharacterized protein YecE (DUF72 family)
MGKMIRIGTSGFSYKDWVGPVYPAGLPERDWLSFYAREFSTVELNVTFYRIPAQRTVAGWVDKTPDDFLFSVKAFQGLTHERENPDFSAFVDSLQPLVSAGKFGCILAQFPHFFHPLPENRDYLKRLREGLGELATVVEFRDVAWAKEAVFDLLRELKFGYCCVDEPSLKGLMPPLAVVTGPVAYLRFHGRNAARWYEHEEAWQRYDYTYSDSELREWVPKLHQLDEVAPLTLVYFNNHFRGQASIGARDLGQLLAQDRLL